MSAQVEARDIIIGRTKIALKKMRALQRERPRDQQLARRIEEKERFLERFNGK